MAKILWTADQAREMGRRSAAGYAERKRRRLEREAQERADDLARLVKSVGAALPTDAYVAERLARVRRQLDRIDELMLTEAAPPALDRLAAAQARVSEQERILAGRPLPGAHRPGPQRRPRIDHEAGPLGLDPAA